MPPPRQTQNSRRMFSRRPARRVIRPPPPTFEQRIKKYFEMVPWIIFGITFAIVLLEYFHGYLIVDMEKEMDRARSLFSKIPFDGTAHVQLIKVVNAFRKFLEQL